MRGIWISNEVLGEGKTEKHESIEWIGERSLKIGNHEGWQSTLRKTKRQKKRRELGDEK